jgi:hypothetical protein
MLAIIIFEDSQWTIVQQRNFWGYCGNFAMTSVLVPLSYFGTTLAVGLLIGCFHDNWCQLQSGIPLRQTRSDLELAARTLFEVLYTNCSNILGDRKVPS